MNILERVQELSRQRDLKNTFQEKQITSMSQSSSSGSNRKAFDGSVPLENPSGSNDRNKSSNIDTSVDQKHNGFLDISPKAWRIIGWSTLTVGVIVTGLILLNRSRKDEEEK